MCTRRGYVDPVSEKETTSDRPRRSINDVRAPIMLMGVAAFCGGRMGEIPIWILLAVAVPASVVIALVFERALIRELIRWTSMGVLVAVGAASVLYAAMALSLQYAAGLSLEDVLSGEGDLPLIFQRLVAIKAQVMKIHPLVAGLGGALILGVGEEIFWRGFVQTRMMLLFRHTLVVLLTTVLYTGFYAILMGPLVAAAAAVGGLVYSILTLKTRSLVPSMVCHGLLWLFAILVMPLV